MQDQMSDPRPEKGAEGSLLQGSPALCKMLEDPFNTILFPALALSPCTFTETPHSTEVHLSHKQPV